MVMVGNKIKIISQSKYSYTSMVYELHLCYSRMAKTVSHQGWQNPGIYEYFPSRREILVNPGIYFGNTGLSGKFNFQDNQTVKLDLIDTRLCTYFSINYGPCRIKLLQLKKCQLVLV